MGGSVRMEVAAGVALAAAIVGFAAGGLALKPLPEPRPAGRVAGPAEEGDQDFAARRGRASRAAIGDEDAPLPPRAAAREAAAVPREAGPAAAKLAAAGGDARRRAQEAQLEAEEALARGDGKRALALFRELAAIGEDADPLAIDLVRRLMAQVRDGRKIGVTTYDLDKELRSAEVVPLLKRSLLDPAADARFRAWAVESLAQSPNEDTLPFVLSLVEQERDGRVKREILNFLGEQSDPQVGGALARSLGGAAEARERIALIDTLGGAPGAEAEQALERAAAGDPDPAVRAAARVELLARNPPAAGYLVTDIFRDSQAAKAGLAPGDILLTYNGMPLGPDVSIAAERDKVRPGQAVAVTLWRDGRVVEVALRGGQIGIDGKGVAPR